MSAWLTFSLTFTDQGTLDKILKFVNKYYQENRVAPTISEVAAGVGVARSTTHRYIQELSDRDLLDYGRGILSAPESAKMKTAYIAAPLVGSIYHRINDCLALPQASIDQYKQQEYLWAFSEIRAILGQMPKGLLIKIPYDFCVIVSENCDNSYTPVWNEDDILNKNFFHLRMTEIILSIIYRDFLVSPEEYVKLIQHDQEELTILGEAFDGSLKEIFTPFSITEAEQDGRGKYAEWLYLGKAYQTLGKLDLAATYLFMAWSTMDSLASFCDELPSHYHEEYVDTCLKLGNIYVEIKDYKAGFEFFTKCADAGSAIGINNLGWMYQHGYGCARDLLQAKALFEEAAHHTNNPSKAACKHLGDLYLGLEDDPEGLIPLNPALALHYYEKAKSLGHTGVDEKIARANAVLESN